MGNEHLVPFIGFNVYTAKPHNPTSSIFFKKLGDSKRRLSYVGSSRDLEKVERIQKEAESGRVKPLGHGPDK